MHAHIFNGRDIPVTGFLQQILLRDTHEPVENLPNEGLINLVKNIILPATPTAANELAEIEASQTLRARSTSALIEQDKINIAEGIARLQRQTKDAMPKALPRSGDSPQPFIALDQETQSNVEILERLNQLRTPLTDPNGPATAAPINPNAPQAFAARSAPTEAPDVQAMEVTEEIFAKRSSVEKRSVNKVGPTNNVSSGSLEQTLRWAGLMTRSRRDVLAELIRLYGGEGRIEVFSPSFIDFEYWLIADEQGVEPSPLEDQIAVMSAIAKREREVVILNFAPFCPLRSALATREGRNHLELYDAALTMGYAGIKLYPPIGFRPTDNASQPGPFGAKPGNQVTGAEIDAELHRLYAWCVANDVPIKAHGNDSISAQQCSGAYASPANWGTVMQRPEFRDLRINIAHFGGFEEDLSPTQNCPPQPDTRPWEEIATELIANGQNVYVDIGFWTDVTRSGSGRTDAIIEKVRELLDTVTNLEDRILYGSDWSMIGRLEGHNYYLADVTAALDQLNVSLDKVMVRNAATYLGLDREGPQLRRLRTFFGPDHKFADLFNLA